MQLIKLTVIIITIVIIIIIIIIIITITTQNVLQSTYSDNVLS